MLNETIKALRKSKGLSQQELAVKVNVVRPDHLKIGSKACPSRLRSADRPVGGPGDACEHAAGRDSGGVGGGRGQSPFGKAGDHQFAVCRRKAVRRAALHWLLIAVCGGILAVASGSGRGKQSLSGLGLRRPGNPPLWGWPSTPFNGALSVWRPFALIAATVGVFLTRKKHKV